MEAHLHAPADLPQEKEFTVSDDYEVVSNAERARTLSQPGIEPRMVRSMAQSFQQ